MLVTGAVDHDRVVARARTFALQVFVENVAAQTMNATGASSADVLFMS